jgi:hypothetical protein
MSLRVLEGRNWSSQLRAVDLRHALTGKGRRGALRAAARCTNSLAMFVDGRAAASDLQLRSAKTSGSPLALRRHSRGQRLRSCAMLSSLQSAVQPA